jgi:hypothetical protein
MILKLLCLLLAICFSSQVKSKKQVDLLTAINKKSVTIHINSFGSLGSSNLMLTIKSLSHDSIYVSIPPGLHFKSLALDKQDLLTMDNSLLALGPQSKATVHLQGFCIQASRYIPTKDTSYKLTGFADESLKTLSELLYKHEFLVDHYGQMFVWALTDKRIIHDVAVDSSMVEAANSAITYVSEITGLEPGKVHIEATRPVKPKLEIFSRKASLAFHNPTEQVASFYMFDADGNVMYTLYKDRKILRGIRVHELGMNDMVPTDTNPVYFFRVMAKSGKILAEKRVDRTTVENKIVPDTLKFRFEYQLDKPVKEARLKIYLPDGTLVEQFKQYTNLQPGNYAISLSFLHLHPAATKFVAKMESADGSVIREQLISKSH